ncbi:MAG TPA: CHAT domain-containing protein [Bacteroidetes bacterium]|nr:CHAT domain-containing protein [Bacteroidota bacterium]
MNRFFLLVNILVLFSACKKDVSGDGGQDAPTLTVKQEETTVPPQPTGTIADTLVAIGWMQEGQDKFILAQYDTALILYNKALEIFKKYPKDASKHIITAELLVAAFNAATSQNVQQSYAVARKALAYYAKNEGSLSSHNSGVAYQLIGSYHFSEGDLDSSLYYFKKALHIFKNEPVEDIYTIAMSHSNIAGILSRLGMNRKGMEHSRKALEMMEQKYGKYHPANARIYNNMAVLFAELEDYSNALIYFRHLVQIYNKTPPSPNSKALTLNNYGNVLANTGHFKEATKFLEQAKQIVTDSLGKAHPLLGSVHYSIGILKYEQKEYSKAISHFQKAVDIWQPYLTLNHPAIAGSYDYIGVAAYRKKEYEKAREYILKAIGIDTRVMGPNYPDVAMFFNEIADLEIHLGNLKKAQYYLDNAFKTLNYRPEDTFFCENTISPKILMESLHLQGRLYFKLFEKRRVLFYLKKSLMAFNKAIETIDFIKTNLLDFASQRYLFQNSYIVIEDAIQANKVACSEFSDKSFCQYAFVLAEKQKDVFLSRTLRENDFFAEYVLTDTLFLKERKIRTSIADLERKAFTVNAAPVHDDSLINEINSKIFYLKNDYGKLMEVIEKNYPDFYNAKNNRDIVSIKHLQDTLLSPHQSLLEYFVGDSTIFLFLITKDTFHVAQVKRDFPLKEWVEQMREGIYAPYTAHANKKKSAQKYAGAAHKLYNKIFRPVAHLLPEGSDLIIVPDGELGYIPFDALLDKMPGDPANFNASDYPYLLKHYTISLSYSATLLKEMRQRKHLKEPTKNLLAFAPGFAIKNTALAQQYMDTTNLRSGMDELPHSIEEVEYIRSLVGGKICTREQATKKNFLREASAYRVIHLSTHGILNDRTGDYSFLAFYDPDNNPETDWLYNRELYNLQLNADMVVLSACETGIGELQRGEGIISLARGFSYAGAKSIVTSLWKVSDGHTSHLMKYFYQKIKDGMPKDQALRAAKMEYISDPFVGNSHSPFYWAGFFAIGDMSPVQLSPPPAPLWQWLLGGVLGLLLLRFVVLKFYGKKKFE